MTTWLRYFSIIINNKFPKARGGFYERKPIASIDRFLVGIECLEFFGRVFKNYVLVVDKDH